MADLHPPAMQRVSMLALAEVLDSRTDALRRDECADWRLSGRRDTQKDRRSGAIYSDGPTSYSLTVEVQNAFALATAKRALSFAVLEVEGDRNARWSLDRLPSKAEAAVIRRVLAIPRRRHLSEEQAQTAREALARGRATRIHGPSEVEIDS